MKNRLFCGRANSIPFRTTYLYEARPGAHTAFTRVTPSPAAPAAPPEFAPSTHDAEAGELRAKVKGSPFGTDWRAMPLLRQARGVHPEPRMKGLEGTSFKQLAKEFLQQLQEDNVFNGAAALAFFLMLAIFPALVFLLSVLPYLPIPDLDRAIMDLLRQALPAEAAGALTDTVEQIATQRQGGLLSIGFIGTIWAAAAGMYAIMQQLNITYRVKEARPFLKARATALLLTLLFGVLIVGALALVVLGGYLQGWLASALGWSGALLAFFAALRWVIILAALLLGFALIYYLGPNAEQKFKWVSPGSVLGVATLLLASVAFRIYVQNFGAYDATYGSIGAIIVLMLWLYVAGFVLLAGSEVNVVYESHLPEGKNRGEKRPGEHAERKPLSGKHGAEPA